MVFNSADYQSLHLVITGNTSQIRPHACFDILTQPGFAVFGAKNQMKVQRGKRVRHAGKLSRNGGLVQVAERLCDGSRVASAHGTNAQSATCVAERRLKITMKPCQVCDAE